MRELFFDALAIYKEQQGSGYDSRHVDHEQINLIKEEILNDDLERRQKIESARLSWQENANKRYKYVNNESLPRDYFYDLCVGSEGMLA